MNINELLATLSMMFLALPVYLVVLSQWLVELSLKAQVLAYAGCFFGFGITLLIIIGVVNGIKGKTQGF